MKKKEIKHTYDADQRFNELIQMCGKVNGIEEVAMQFDMPVYYKELTLYPVIVQFYTFFNMFVECLILPKHRVANIEVIQMSYLNFLFYKNESLEIDNLKYAMYLKELLLLVLRKPRTYMIGTKEVETIDFEIINKEFVIRIENHTYDHKDLEVIRTLICQQNSIEMPDTSIHPSLEKKYLEYKEYQKKQLRGKSCDLEGLILSLISETSLTKEDIINLSIRTFNKLITRIDQIMNYKLNVLLSPNLPEQTRKNLLGWLTEPKTKTMIEEMSSSMSVDDLVRKAAGS